MPIDAGENGNILRVLNAGSKELSLIDLEAPVTTGVVTVDWSGTFLDLAHPIRLKMDPEYGVYYVTDWKNAVRVFKIATDQQIKSIDVVDVPVGLTLTDSSLWVATPKKDIWEPTGNSVVEIDRKTQEVKGRVTDPGMLMPGGIATYDTAQP
jgi:hypothetical protein